MTLTRVQKTEIESMVENCLNNAERVWKDHGKELTKAGVVADESFSARADSGQTEIVQSRIPQHPLVYGDNPTVSDFIALVADMRKSSDHLLCAISRKKADVSLLQRLYYETSALLPALEMTLSYEDGAVTEYLGDGILSLFCVNEGNIGESIKKAYRSAKNCLGDTRSIVNRKLNDRYKLPELNIGIGLSYSEALVQLVGIAGKRHPKVIGKCVYYASKLSAGVNEIYADDRIKDLWPTSKNGKLQFIERKSRGTNGFIVS